MTILHLWLHLYAILSVTCMRMSVFSLCEWGFSRHQLCWNEMYLNFTIMTSSCNVMKVYAQLDFCVLKHVGGDYGCFWVLFTLFNIALIQCCHDIDFKLVSLEFWCFFQIHVNWIMFIKQDINMNYSLAIYENVSNDLTCCLSLSCWLLVKSFHMTYYVFPKYSVVISLKILCYHDSTSVFFKHIGTFTFKT